MRVHLLPALIRSQIMESRLPLSFAVALFGFILSLGMVTLSMTGGESWRQLQLAGLPDGASDHERIAGLFPQPIYLLEACI
jgi:hypothetical protein